MLRGNNTARCVELKRGQMPTRREVFRETRPQQQQQQQQEQQGKADNNPLDEAYAPDSLLRQQLRRQKLLILELRKENCEVRALGLYDGMCWKRNGFPSRLCINAIVRCWGLGRLLSWA